MTTLISVHNSGGCIGRCDSKCYNAIHPDCDCVCGGANHGVGINKAIEQTTELAESWIEEYRKRHEDELKFLVLPKPVQLALL